MRKIGDLMNDLGFNKDASLEVQKAFIRHLVRAADRSTPQNVSPIAEQKREARPPTQEKANSPQQLSFDPEILKAR